MSPAEDQSVTPLPVLDPAQPPLVLPLTSGRAIDDPNTALLQDVRRAVLRRSLASLITLAILGALLGLVVADHQIVGAVGLGIVVALLLGLLAFAQWLHQPQLRRGKALLSRYPWRAAPARLLADKPCLARITLDEGDLTLRLRRLNRIGEQTLLRTGTLWICGPDERGRALVRVAGSAGQALADVTDATPTGLPPAPIRPSGPRPGDDPALIWARRTSNRTMLIIVAVCVLLDGLAIGYLTKTGFDYPNAHTIGLAVGLTLLVVLMCRGWFSTARQFRRYDAAPYWQPVQVSLDTWDAASNVAVRTGTGRIILPNGWRGYVEFPRLQLDLAANLRATGVLWVAGDAVPGQTVPIGLPGFPLRGVVKIQR